MRGSIMVYCSCKKTNYNRNLTCTYYIHCLSKDSLGQALGRIMEIDT